MGLNEVIGFLILACEIGFWVFVIAGLVARYRFNQKNLSLLLFLCTPLIDLFLLIFTVVDLKNGAVADFFHGLAAVYIGVSLVYGKQMISWADRRYAYHFAGEKPIKRKTYGKERAIEERKGWYRHFLSWLIGGSLLALLIIYVNNLEQTFALLRVLFGWTMVLIIDFLISFSYTVFPKRR